MLFEKSGKNGKNPSCPALTIRAFGALACGPSLSLSLSLSLSQSAPSARNSRALITGAGISFRGLATVFLFLLLSLSLSTPLLLYILDFLSLSLSLSLSLALSRSLFFPCIHRVVNVFCALGIYLKACLLLSVMHNFCFERSCLLCF